MIKLPEPVACYAGHRLTPEGTNEFYGYADTPMPMATKLYTEAQLKQAVRDALTLTIQRLNGDTYNLTKAECVEEIRALIKEI